MINAILYVLKGGIPWRLLPSSFPPCKTVYHVFRAWTRDQTWAALNDALLSRPPSDWKRIAPGMRRSDVYSVVGQPHISNESSKGGVRWRSSRIIGRWEFEVFFRDETVYNFGRRGDGIGGDTSVLLRNEPELASLGAASPLGWLCARIIAAALVVIASRNTSRHEDGIGDADRDELVPLHAPPRRCWSRAGHRTVNRGGGLDFASSRGADSRT